MRGCALVDVVCGDSVSGCECAHMVSLLCLLLTQTCVFVWGGARSQFLAVVNTSHPIISCNSRTTYVSSVFYVQKFLYASPFECVSECPFYQ